MFGIGTNELLIIGGVIVLLFGGSKLSQLGKGLGEGIREFRTSMEGTDKNEEKTVPAPVAPVPTAAREESHHANASI